MHTILILLSLGQRNLDQLPGTKTAKHLLPNLIVLFVMLGF